MQVQKRFWVTANDGKEFDSNCVEVKQYRKYHPELSVESAMIAVAELHNKQSEAEAAEVKK